MTLCPMPNVVTIRSSPMLIKSCFQCKYHEIRQEGLEKFSRCNKENCYAQYSKCIAGKALHTFLEQENSDRHKPFSAINHIYPVE